MKNRLLLLTALLILFVGCKDENDGPIRSETNLKQGWKLTSQKINGAETDLSSTPIRELMLFSEQNLCYLAIPVLVTDEWGYKDLRTAWSYTEATKNLNIAGLLPVTYYIDALTTSQLQIHYYAYNSSGEIDVYEKTFNAAQIEVKDLKIRLSE